MDGAAVSGGEGAGSLRSRYQIRCALPRKLHLTKPSSLFLHKSVRSGQIFVGISVKTALNKVKMTAATHKIKPGIIKSRLFINGSKAKGLKCFIKGDFVGTTRAKRERQREARRSKWTQEREEYLAAQFQTLHRAEERQEPKKPKRKTCAATLADSEKYEAGYWSSHYTPAEAVEWKPKRIYTIGKTGDWNGKRAKHVI
jgi:hypothetical protein